MKKAPTLLSIVISFVALILAGLGQNFLASNEILYAVILYGIAALLFIFACRRLPESRLTPTVSFPSQLGRRNWWCILLTLVGVGLGAYSLWEFNIEKPSDADWWMLTASVAIIVGAGYLSDWFTSRSTDDNSEPDTASNTVEDIERNRKLGRPSEMTWILLILIFVIGAFMRLYQFDTLPFGIWYDEAANGLESFRLMNEPEFRIVYTDGVNSTVHYLALIVASFRLFGISVYAIRAVSVVMGLGTIIAGFLAGRELFRNNAMALTLAFFLAVSRWTVNFSRIGMYNIATPLFELLAIYFILRGLRRSSHGDLAMAGLSIGLGLCFYSAYQLFAAALILFFLILMLREWGFFQKAWTGLVVMAIVSLLTVGPVARFAYEKSDKFFSRVQKTSLLENTPPDQQVDALIRNTRKHFLMFNYWGDPNGRHNLPGEPMLDPFTGALAVLGLAFALWRIRYMRMLLLPIWLCMTLLGGILSLDFEAPQSLRAIGSLPVAYILAVLPLHALWQQWQHYIQDREPSWRTSAHALTLPILILLAAVGYSNYHTYFERQAKDFSVWNSFSTPETLVATLLAQSDDETEVYVTAYFQSHPTIRFIERVNDTRFVYRSIETTEHLPLNWTPAKPVSLIVDARSRYIFDEAGYLYPDAVLQELKPPFGGPVVVSHAKLSVDALNAVQGLNVAYYANEDWRGDPVLTGKDLSINLDWSTELPLDPPFSVEWTGILRVRAYGPHRFAVQGPGRSELYVGEEPMLRGINSMTPAFMLAQGNHDIRLRALVTNTETLDEFQLIWHPPDSGVEIVPSRSLYVDPIHNNGLLGRYYTNSEWSGAEAFARIDPQLNIYFHLTPLARPYTVHWEGKIAIPVSGNYKFGLESIDGSELWINGESLVKATNDNQLTVADVMLPAGLHDVDIRFTDATDHTHINFYWMPPGGRQQIVPSSVLFPPQANYERVDLPNAGQLGLMLGSASIDDGNYLEAESEVLITGLNAPKGIGVGPDGTIYVADTGNQQLLLFTEDGEQIASIQEGSVPLEEPFDVAVDVSNDPAGEVIVTDASRAVLEIFDAKGGHLSTISTNPGYLNHSRGLDVDTQGRIWIAATTANRAVALDREGLVLKESIIGRDKITQPTDVLVDEDGALFVAEAEQHTLVRFGADGRLLLTRDIPKTSTVNGAHMALVPLSPVVEESAEESNEESEENGENGEGISYLYITEPEKSRVAVLDRFGERIGIWMLLPTEDGSPRKPVGIAVDEAGRILVTDSASGDVIRLTPVD